VAAERTPVLVIGGGGHAKVLLHVLERLPQFSILGYIDPKDNGPILGHPRLGGDDAAAAILREHRKVAAALGVGKVRAGGGRVSMLEKFGSMGFVFPAIVAPSAVVSRDIVLGEGAVILDGAVVQPGCRLGRAVIVNTSAVVDHDCILDDDVHVATGAVLSGGIRVAAGALVGAGASCRQGVRIGAGCTIAAGATVACDCLEPGVYVGVPAKRRAT
jgi:sugar O-acyltransferase (sialic acid O-acetyltransferase NeuD family)